MESPFLPSLEFVRRVDRRERALAPFSITRSNKQEGSDGRTGERANDRAFVFGDLRLVVNIAKEPTRRRRLFSGPGLCENRRSEFGLRHRERRDRTGDEGERDEDREGETDGERGRKKPGAGAGGGKAREKCVGIEPCGRPTGPRNIALRKYARVHTHVETCAGIIRKRNTKAPATPRIIPGHT